VAEATGGPAEGFPADRRYTREHEWVRLDGGEALVGVTDHAQRELGDVVYVELPAVGADLARGRPFGVVESVKSVSDLFAPVAGRVLRINGRLADEPELVNRDPYGEGWMIALQPSDPAELEGLLSAAEYRVHVEGDGPAGARPGGSAGR
jgi:glycine cleavage system H protein